MRLDEVVEQNAEDRGRKEGNDDVQGESPAFGVPPEEAADHLEHAGPVEAEDREDGAALDDDVEGIRGAFARRVIEAQQARGDDEVSGRGDRQVLGDALDESQDDRLPPLHAERSSAIQE